MRSALDCILGGRQDDMGTITRHETHVIQPKAVGVLMLKSRYVTAPDMKRFVGQALISGGMAPSDANADSSMMLIK